MMVDEGNGYEEATYNGSWVHLTVNGRHFNIAVLNLLTLSISTLHNIRIPSTWTVSEAEKFFSSQCTRQDLSGTQAHTLEQF